MNHFRKVLALTLSLLMVLGTTVSIGAKKFDDVANDNQYAEQIDLLSEIGIILGTSENEFSPDKNITREQMALLLYRMMLGDNNAGNVNTSPFTDLYDPTYHGAISWAAANEYIFGVGGTNFAPRNGIIFQDAITMLVRLLGHETDRMNRGYPWTYIEAGVKLGLTDGLQNLSYTAVMNRGQIAALLYNALTADYLIPKNIAGNTFYTTSTIIEEVFGYSIEEAILTATNDYALPGFARVIKNNYVTLTYNAYVGETPVAKTLYVNYAELGISADANTKLGERVKIIFTVDPKTNLVSVLGALEVGRSEHFNTVTVGKNNKYVEIDGVQYNVVQSYSDLLGTNNNELLVYRYNTDGTISQITSNTALAANLGFFSLEMIYDDKGEIASRAILTPYTLAQLQLDRNGGLNIAGGLTTAQLSGGFHNPAKAEVGDYVLYFFNSNLKSLEISEVLGIIEGALVTKLTATEATVGGISYKLGMSGTSITPASIAAQLTIGTKANIVVHNGHIVAVTQAVAQSNSSKYLIAMSGTTPVYADGGVRYFMTANINGVNNGIFVTNPEAVQGKVYRYLIDDNGFYHLIPMTVENNVIVSGTNSFVQNTNGLNEMALYIASAAETTIGRGENFFYTIGTGADTLIGSAGVTTPINFLTNDETVILVNTPSGIRVKTGSYSSTITVNAGASVTAIFSDRPGSIEMLRFLYISDGQLGSVNEGASYAKVYSVLGLEYVNGTVMTAYKAYNFNSGAMETILSPFNSLSVGTTYAIDSEGHLSNVERRTAGGIVTGYNDGVITIGNEVYKLATNAKIHSISGSFAVSSIDIADVYMHNVEIFAEGREIKTILAGPALSFTASTEGNTITLTPNMSLSSISDPQFNLNGVSFNGTLLNGENLSLSVDGDTIKVESTEALADGLYVLSINLFDHTFTVSCNKTTSAAE